MFRRFGQFLALIAVMASVLNAQCALSCSMQEVSKTGQNQASFVESADMGHAGHECCPGETTPKPTKDDKSRSCSDPLLTTNSVDVSNVVKIVDSPHCFDFVLISRSEPVPSALRPTLAHSPADSPAFPDVRAFFILRI